MDSKVSLPLLCVLAAVGFWSASAFDAGQTGTRAVAASVVGDAASYIAVEANGNSPHKNFVTTSGGKISISFGSGVATGTGVNPDSNYYFDDLLNITNQGTIAANVQVTTESTTGTIKVCVLTSPDGMTNSCYAATSPASPQALAVGSKLYVGLMTDATGLSSSNSVSGTLNIVATR